MFKPMLRFETISGEKDLYKAWVYGGDEQQKRSYGHVIPRNKFGLPV